MSRTSVSPFYFLDEHAVVTDPLLPTSPADWQFISGKNVAMCAGVQRPHFYQMMGVDWPAVP
jgi:hypothetical protein